MSSKRFSKIYSKNEWGYGSGEGSLEIHTRKYRCYLQKFLREKKIKSVVDVGCGDWQFSKFIDWSGVNYTGYDVVSFLVEKNNREYSSRNVSFICCSGDPGQLRSADLLIVKDVFQHLQNQEIFRFLNILPNYKYALITNCTNPRGRSNNQDITSGDFHYLDMRSNPFNLRAECVLSFQKSDYGMFEKIRELLRGYPAWKKEVLLVDCTSQS